MKREQKKLHRNEKGMATIETLPLLFIFVMLVTYMLGFFGAIHSSIMNSISARSYAFETFRNRTNLVFFRDDPGSNSNQYRQMGDRIHGIVQENRPQGDNSLRAVERPIRVGASVAADSSRNDTELHNTKIFDTSKIDKGKRNNTLGVSPIWIMVQYGICVTADCGGD